MTDRGGRSGPLFVVYLTLVASPHLPLRSRLREENFPMASKKKSFDRRGFLKNAAVGAAAMAAAAPIAAAQQVRAAVPSAAAAETASLPKPAEVLTNNRPGA